VQVGPLLPGSAQNIENDVTYSKQTTDKFLPGATTHIRISNFRSSTTQNPAQLIQHRRYRTNPRRSNHRTSRRTSNRNRPANRNHRKQVTKPLLTETRIAHVASRNRTSNRFWPKNRSYRKQTTRPRLTGTRSACLAFRNFTARRGFREAYDPRAALDFRRSDRAFVGAQQAAPAIARAILAPSTRQLTFESTFCAAPATIQATLASKPRRSRHPLTLPPHWANMARTS